MTVTVLGANAGLLGKFWRAFWLALRVYGVLLIMMYLLQRQLMFLPSRLEPEAAQRMAGELGLRPIRAENQWIAYELPTVKPITRQWLILHGNAGHALHRAAQANALQAVSAPGTRVWILEYPGYGARDGSPTQDSMGAAAIAAFRQMQSDSPVPISVFAESLGSGVAGELLHAEAKVAGVLWLTPFDDMIKLAGHHYPWLPAEWLIRDRFSPATKAAGYRGRSAVIVAKEDQIVPAQRGKALYDALPGEKLWLELPGGHNPHFDGSTAWLKQAVSWLQNP